MTTKNDVTIRTVEGKNADFTDYKTFFLLPEPPIGDGTNQLVRSFPRQVVETAVLRELKARNYKQIASLDDADMLLAIQFTLQDEQRTREITNYSSYGSRYGGYGYGYGYRSHYGYRTFPSTTIEIENFRKGNMIIDLIDRQENALVWEAFAQGKGETELDKIEAKVNRVVTEIFTNYPHVASNN